MMRLVADTVGVHDLICGSCSEEYYRNRLDYTGPHRSCRSNLAEALAPWGVELQDVPFSFNFFMQWPVQPDGAVRPMAAPSRAGDYVDLLAEMDVLVANSACLSDITPTNAHRPTRYPCGSCSTSQTSAPPALPAERDVSAPVRWSHSPFCTARQDMIRSA